MVLNENVDRLGMFKDLIILNLIVHKYFAKLTIGVWWQGKLQLG